MSYEVTDSGSDTCTGQAQIESEGRYSVDDALHIKNNLGFLFFIRAKPWREQLIFRARTDQGKSEELEGFHVGNKSCAL
jgi:hypothetical protein